MALEERRTLKEVAILVDRGHIHCLWADEIIKNGEVIHSSDHRGAYPLNEDGEPDSTVVGALGTTIADLIGEVAQTALADLTTLQTQHQVAVAIAQNTIADLQSEISTLQQTIADLQNQLNTAQSPSSELEAVSEPVEPIAE